MGFVNFLCPTTLWANENVTDKVISRYGLFVPALALELRPHRLNLYIRTLKRRPLREDGKCLQQRFFGESAASPEPKFSHTLDFLLLQFGQQIVNERLHDIKFVHEPLPLGSIVFWLRILMRRLKSHHQVFFLEGECIVNQTVGTLSAYARRNWSSIQATTHKPASNKITKSTMMPHCGWTGTSLRLKSGA